MALMRWYHQNTLLDLLEIRVILRVYPHRRQPYHPLFLGFLQLPIISLRVVVRCYYRVDEILVVVVNRIQNRVPRVVHSVNLINKSKLL